GVSYLSEVKDSIVNAFTNLCYKGPLCDEPIRGIKFTVTDITLHADAIHRGMGQIEPMASRAMNAAILTCEPRLIDAHYKLEVYRHTCESDIPSLDRFIDKL